MTGATVFISYSHADEQEKNALLLHLGVLRGAGLIDLWSDDRIKGGADWETEIEEAMAQARIAILLISANFLTSDFILNNEVPVLLKHREERGLVTFPVIAKECAWKKIGWLSKMNVRPKNGVPIWTGNGIHADKELTKIAYEIAEIVSAGIDSGEAQKEEVTAKVSTSKELHLFLVTEEGKRYETMVRANLPVAQLVTDFLTEWPQPESPTFVRHSLKLEPDGRLLDTTLTLAEAGVSNEMSLYVVEEKILPTSSVGLIVEDAEGHRFVTNVLLDTSVRRLAAEFMNSLGKPSDRPTVELLGRAAGEAARRRLRDESTLYEERVQNGSHLRVLANS
jgi:hypothetical protein